MRPETAVVLVVAGVCKEVALYLQEVTDYFPFRRQSRCPDCRCPACPDCKAECPEVHCDCPEVPSVFFGSSTSSTTSTSTATTVTSPSLAPTV